MVQAVRTKTFTPVLDTNAYADNDVMFVAIEVEDVFDHPGQALTLHSVNVIDGDDQNVDFDLLFFKETVTLGTINGAVNISDADAKKSAGAHVSLLAASNATDLINSIMYTKGTVGTTLQAATNSTSLWVAGVIRSGTPTYSASGMQITLGFLY